MAGWPIWLTTGRSMLLGSGMLSPGLIRKSASQANCSWKIAMMIITIRIAHAKVFTLMIDHPFVNWIPPWDSR